MKLKLILFIISSFCLTVCNQAVAYEYEFEHDEESEYNNQEHAQYALSVTDIALKQLGKPYKYGGDGPYNFDCSGLVYYAYTKAGIDIPRTSMAQLHHAIQIPEDSLQSGDLVFFSISKNKISHVGIYLENNHFIHSPSPGKRVQIVDMNRPYWKSRFVTAARIPH